MTINCLTLKYIVIYGIILYIRTVHLIQLNVSQNSYCHISALTVRRVMLFMTGSNKPRVGCKCLTITSIIITTTTTAADAALLKRQG